MFASQNSRMTWRHIPQGESGALTSLAVSIEMTGKRIGRSVRDDVVSWLANAMGKKAYVTTARAPNVLIPSLFKGMKHLATMKLVQYN